jgi:hypothetical protein
MISNGASVRRAIFFNRVMSCLSIRKAGRSFQQNIYSHSPDQFNSHTRSLKIILTIILVNKI